MTHKKKLIEVALPLAAINRESAREKSIRHGHPSTLHLWWARRPLAAARAVLWASLVDDPSAHPDKFPSEEDQQVERKRLFDILERLVPWEASGDPKVLAEARGEIDRSCGGDLPKVLDPFGGGGAIPLEALRLGLPTYTGDLNPVAVLIQRAMLEIPGRFLSQPPVDPEAQASQGVWEGARGLAADVEAYGRWMHERAQERIGDFYPDVIQRGGVGAAPIAWIWARTIKSPDPAWGEHVPLVKSWTIARRARGDIWVEPHVDRATKGITYEIREGGDVPAGTVGRGQAVCLATGSPISTDYIKQEGLAGRLGARLMAVVTHTSGGRQYVAPVPADEERAAAAHPAWEPSGAMPPAGQGLGLRVQAYGFTEWASLFTPRQMLALTTFSDLLQPVRQRIEEDAIAAGRSTTPTRLHAGGDGAAAYADAVCTYLALAIDKCADYGSSWSTWVDQGEFVSNIFKQQAIPPNWDFAEANPLSESTGSWLGMVKWIAKVLEGSAIPAEGSANVANRDARSSQRGRQVCGLD